VNVYSKISRVVCGESAEDVLQDRYMFWTASEQELLEVAAALVSDLASYMNEDPLRVLEQLEKASS